jgi:hypothetical protein
MNEGNFGLGFLAGFCGGLIGLLIVIFLAKDQPATKKGAIYGFVTVLVLNCLFGIVYAIMMMSMGSSGSYGGY